jgi:hypothetical protein
MKVGRATRLLVMDHARKAFRRIRVPIQTTEWIKKGKHMAVSPLWPIGNSS